MSNDALNDLIGQRVRDTRKQADVSVDELVQRCADQGLTLSPGQVYLIEGGGRGKTGRPRRRITVDELLVIAYVLDVSPLALLLPRWPGDEYPATGITVTNAFQALEWFAGERLPPLPAPDQPDEWEDEDRARAWYQMDRMISYLPESSLHWTVRQERARLFKQRQRTDAAYENAASMGEDLRQKIGEYIKQADRMKAELRRLGIDVEGDDNAESEDQADSGQRPN